MLSFMKRFEDPSYALMRVFAGLMFAFHGSQKLVGWPLPAHEGTPAFITWVAGPIELVGGLMVAAGLLAAPAAFLCSGTMAFAYWMAHGTKALLPIANGGEMAVLYCFLFLYVSAKGSGAYSIDAARAAR